MSQQGREQRARREAAAWFTRLGRRSVTTQSLREFRDWRGEPANAHAYAQVERTWSKAGDLARDPDILAATQAALRPRRTLKPTTRALLWAAPLATAAIAAALLLRPVLLPPAYETGTGEQRLVVLEDGSRVRLNTDSRLTVRFTPKARQIRLARGEAFFEVAHDPTRPFTVDAGQADVRALGTRFDVRRDPDAIHVTLVEGKVKVSEDAGDRAWTLAPSQQLTVAPRQPAAPRAADTARATSWTSGRLIFDGQPLSEAIAEVNRYAPRKVRLAAPALAARPVSGVFDTGDTQAFTAAVGALFDLKATRQPDGSIVLESPAA